MANPSSATDRTVDPEDCNPADLPYDRNGELVTQFAAHGLGHPALKACEAVRGPYAQSIVEAAKNPVIDPKAWKNKGA